MLVQHRWKETSQIIITFAELFCRRRQWHVIRPRGQTVELQLHERHCSPDVLVPEWCRFNSSGVALWRTEIASQGFQNKTSHDTNNLVPRPPVVSRKAHVRCDNHCFRSTLIGSGNLFWQQISRFRVKRREFWELLLPQRPPDLSCLLRVPAPASPRGTWRRLPDSTHRRSHLLQSSATFYLMQ